MVRARRPKPKHLAAKLLAIRQACGASQSEMVRFLNYQVTSPRVSEYEMGKREPNLIVLLAYARAATIPLENLIDDDLDLFD